MGVIRGDLGLVSDDHVEVFAIRCGYDRVRTVLARCIAQGFEFYQLVELVVAIGIEQAKDAQVASSATPNAQSLRLRITHSGAQIRGMTITRAGR